MKNLNLVWITDAFNPIFTNLFKEYFKELGISLKEENRLWDEMNNDLKLYDIKILVLLEHEIEIGFSMFQVDKEENPWCMKPGAGDIREFYVKKEYRKKGYGTYMFEIIKKYFSDISIRELLLTSSKDDGEQFWVKQGFKDTGSINSKNKLKEFINFLS